MVRPETAADCLRTIHLRLEEAGFYHGDGSLAVPLIWDLLNSLTDVLNSLRWSSPGDNGKGVSQERAMLLLSVHVFLKDFSSGVMTYKEGMRRQPHSVRLN